MRKIAWVLIAVSLSGCAAAQNTGARATPQTQNAAPAGAAVAPPAGNGAQGNGAQGRGAQPPAGRSSVRGASRRGGAAASSQRKSQPAANASVQVIGGSDGSQSQATSSAALPGIPMLHNAMGIKAGTPIEVRLSQAVDSGHAHNGDKVNGVLASPLGQVPSGAPVTLTVVAAAPAGVVGSSGVLSLQVVSVNGEQVLSQVITAEGQEGKKELPDAAPALGTEAVFSTDQPVTLPAA